MFLNKILAVLQEIFSEDVHQPFRFIQSDFAKFVSKKYLHSYEVQSQFN
jgi:hypothetical protein